MTHSRKAFLDKRKHDQYHQLAENLNVRARSYFKLQQINNKYELIKDGMTIIDLGCAPGGWLQYMDKLELKNSKIIGIDLLPLKKQSEFSKNIEIIEDDFANIEDYVDGEFDLVLSDMAPEFSGNGAIDRGRTHKLNHETLKFAKKHLKKGGSLAFKTFEGEDLDGVRKIAKSIFWSVKDFKPKSSQMKSPEFFLICKEKKE